MEKTFKFEITTEKLWKWTAWALFITALVLSFLGHTMQAIDAAVAAVFFLLVPLYERVETLEQTVVIHDTTVFFTPDDAPKAGTNEETTGAGTDKGETLKDKDAAKSNPEPDVGE